MKPLLIHGQLETTVVVSDLPQGLVNLVRPKCSAKLQRARAGHPPHVIPGLDPDDLIQLELEDGIILWIRAEDLGSDFGLSPSRGMDSAGVELPYAPPIGFASRGLVGDWIIKGLKIFEITIVETTTRLSICRTHLQ